MIYIVLERTDDDTINIQVARSVHTAWNFVRSAIAADIEDGCPPYKRNGRTFSNGMSDFTVVARELID